MTKEYKIFLNILITMAIIALFGGAILAAEPEQGKIQPVIHLTPMGGETGEKVIIYGAGFEPGEKVKIILQMGNVPLQWAEEDSGGVVIANQYGAFKLAPRGGIPVAAMYVKPGIYVVKALGDKGSKAIEPIEILEKAK